MAGGRLGTRGLPPVRIEERIGHDKSKIRVSPGLLGARLAVSGRIRRPARETVAGK